MSINTCKQCGSLEKPEEVYEQYQIWYKCKNCRYSYLIENVKLSEPKNVSSTIPKQIYPVVARTCKHYNSLEPLKEEYNQYQIWYICTNCMHSSL